MQQRLGALGRVLVFMGAHECVAHTWPTVSTALIFMFGLPKSSLRSVRPGLFIHTKENDNGYMVCAICFEDSTKRMLHVHIHLLYITDECVHRRLTTCRRARARVDGAQQVLQHENNQQRTRRSLQG